MGTRQGLLRMKRVWVETGDTSGTYCYRSTVACMAGSMGSRPVVTQVSLR